MKTLSERLEESAAEVASFPHPSACDHLHDASALMHEAAEYIKLMEGGRITDRYDFPMRFPNYIPGAPK
jgi:hypothetical protein